MKWRILSAALVLGMFLAAPARAREPVTVTLNGNAMAFEVPPLIVEDRVMVPMRAIFEALGAEVDWIGEEQIIIAARGSLFVSMKIGSPVMIVQDLAVDAEQQRIQLDAPPLIEGERTLVPVRAVSESLGAAVDWISDTATVQITAPAANLPEMAHADE